MMHSFKFINLWLIATQLTTASSVTSNKKANAHNCIKHPLQNARCITAFASTRPNPAYRSAKSSNTKIYATNNEQPSFLSTKKATVQFTSSQPSNLSPVDSLLLTVTSDRFSLLFGSIGIILLLLNRLLTFPEDVIYEGTRSRIDLLGVFAAGSVLLNGITKLDVTSVQAERVALEGVQVDKVVWLNGTGPDDFVETVDWALESLIKCSPARSTVLLEKSGESKWTPIAALGVLPIDETLQRSIPEERSTPILDRMTRCDASSINTKGGSVAGTSLGRNRGPKESYLPTLQALPGRVEFTYLPTNTQEVLVLPVPTKDAEDGERCFALVLGGDTAKSFAPKDVVWCREIAAWIGDSLED